MESMGKGRMSGEEGKRKGRVLVLVVASEILLGMLSSQVIGAGAVVETKTYKDKFTLQGALKDKEKRGVIRGQWSVDDNIWVYTSAFAKRFGMPKEWMDDSLKGAYALAYRIIQTNRTKCQSDGGCWRIIENYLDIYVPHEVGIPWHTQEQKGMVVPSNGGSDVYLTPMTEQDRKGWLKWMAKYQSRNLAIPGIGYAAVERGHVTMASLGIDSIIMEYFRNLYPGVDYISMSPTGTFEGDIQYGSIELWFFVPKKIDWQVRPLAGRLNEVAKNIDYKIYVPDQFMKRVRNYRERYYEYNLKAPMKVINSWDAPWWPTRENGLSSPPANFKVYRERRR